MVYLGQVIYITAKEKRKCKHKCKNPKNSSSINQATYKNSKAMFVSETHGKYEIQ